MGKDVLPDNLKDRKHDDWPLFFKYVPRAWTSFDWGKPKKLAGNQPDTKPIGQPGTWQVSYYPDAPWYLKPFAWYVAYSFKAGSDGKFRQIRLGARYDDVDNYTNFPTFPTGRKYTGDDSQDTNNWD